MNEQQLDALIRRSLEWQAERAAATQPTLRAAARTVASRVGQDSRRVRPRVVFLPAAATTPSVLMTLLLLLVLLGAAIVAGALLLERLTPDLRPGPFGFATTCGPSDESTSDLHVEVDGRSTTRLHGGGVLVTDLSVAGETNAAGVRQALFEERRLTARGTRLLLGHLGAAGLTPGCRSVRTADSAGHIVAKTDAGYVEAAWGPEVGNYRPARVAASDEEFRLLELAGQLSEPERWLPADAFVESEPRRGPPDHWLVTIASLPTDYKPGDRLALPNGINIEGSDPRHEQVILPGGADVATFGRPFPVDPAEPRGNYLVPSVRCASLTPGEALALAESLDRLVLGADGWGDFFSTDLSTVLAIGLQPGVTAAYDCQALYEADRPDRPLMPTPAIEPEGDLAAIDPCDLVPDDEPILRALAVQRLVTQATLLAGAPANSCALFDTTGNMSETMGRYGYWRAALTLYPSRIGPERARDIALALLGEGAVEEDTGTYLLWANACVADELGCGGMLAAWSNGRLLVFEHAPRRGPQGARIPAAAGRSFLAAALIRR